MEHRSDPEPMDVDSDDESVVFKEDQQLEQWGIDFVPIISRSQVRIIKARCLDDVARAVSGMREFKKERELRRDRVGVVSLEKATMKILYPLPGDCAITMYEHFFCQLATALEMIQTAEDSHTALLARTSVFLSFVSIDTANVLHNLLAVHESCPERKPEMKRGKQRSDLLSRKLPKFVKTLAQVSKPEQERILNAFKYSREAVGTKARLQRLKAIFQQLSESFGTIGNEFYAGKAKSLFEVSSEIDLQFQFVSKKEMTLHLNTILESLEKASRLLLFIKSSASSLTLCLEKVLDEVDSQGLSFLCPIVLPNVSFENKNYVVDGDGLNVLVYLEECDTLFHRLLSSGTILSCLELNL